MTLSALRSIPSKTVLVLFLPLLTSCQNTPLAETLDKDGVIHINFDASQEITLEEALQDIEVIPLEESADSYLGSVSKVIIEEEEIYILSRSQVFIFNHKGEYISTISNQTEGPVKIGLIYDFDVNRFTGKVDLLSPRGRLVEYDRKTETYTEKINVTDQTQARSFHAFANASPDVVVFYSGYDDHFLHGYSIEQEDFIWEEVKNEGFKYRFLMGVSPSFFWKDGNIMLYEHLGSNLIAATNEGADAVAEVDFGRHQFNLEEADPGIKESFDNVIPYLEDNPIFYPITDYFSTPAGDLVITGWYRLKPWFLWGINGNTFKIELPQKVDFRLLDKSVDGYLYGIIVSPDEETDGLPTELKKAVDKLVAESGGKEVNPVLFRFRFREV